MNARITVILIFATFFSVAVTTSAAESGFVWDTSDYERIKLQWNKKPALIYLMPELDESTPERRNATCKPIHHVFSPDGLVKLTRDLGGDLPNLAGMFYGFSEVTYADGKTCDMWHCTSGALQQGLRHWHMGLDLDSEEDIAAIKNDDNPYNHVSLREDVYWHPQTIHYPDGRGVQSKKSIALESRIVGICRAQRYGVEGWEIDFISILGATYEWPILLEDDGSGAGFRFCASEEVAKKTANLTYYLRPDGKGKLGECLRWDPNNLTSPGSIRCENRPWTALSFVLNDERYTVLCIQHSTNPKPSYFNEDTSGCFGPTFAAKITKDEPLTVIYRLWIQKGEMTVLQCAELHQEFVPNFRKQLLERYNGALQISPK